jgi:hypothetical protein
MRKSSLTSVCFGGNRVTVSNDRTWPGKRLIGLPIPDTQLENPRGVVKSLVDPDRSSSFPDTGHYPEVKRTFA